MKIDFLMILMWFGVQFQIPGAADPNSNTRWSRLKEKRAFARQMILLVLECLIDESSVPYRGYQVSRFECVSGLSVYWPIIALGTRECGVSKLCRDPTVQSEFFLRGSLLFIAIDS